MAQHPIQGGVVYFLAVLATSLWLFCDTLVVSKSLHAGYRVDYYAMHRQPKLNIREPLNYKDLYGITTDLCKMAETNIVFSIKSTYLVSTCILCHLPAFQADSKPFR